MPAYGFVTRVPDTSVMPRDTLQDVRDSFIEQVLSTASLLCRVTATAAAAAAAAAEMTMRRTRESLRGERHIS